MNRINLKAIAYTLGTLIVAIWILISNNATFAVNLMAMTIAVYIAGTIVVGGGREKLLKALLIAFFAVVVSDFVFYFLPSFIALCLSLFVLLIAMKRFLIEDHDAGWFGAICIVLLSSLFLLIIEIVIVMTQLFLPILQDFTRLQCAGATLFEQPPFKSLALAGVNALGNKKSMTCAIRE